MRAIVIAVLVGCAVSCAAADIRVANLAYSGQQAPERKKGSLLIS
jgi:hypothetical protein